LNDGKSLPPGSYRLKITGHRVRFRAATPENPESVPVPLQSNEVSFQIVEASAEWQAETIIRSCTHARLRRPFERRSPARRQSPAFLDRNLNARIARRFWDSNDQPFGWDFKFGLFGSPFRIQRLKE